MTSRELTEKVLRLAYGHLEDTVIDLNDTGKKIESLLAGAMAERENCVACYIGGKKDAYLDAARVAEAFGDDCCTELATALRTKAGGLG